ncbi:hypothetical protein METBISCDRAFT_21267 [Metschnikowia bicuspidata]|uniref:HCP-like protein n=1 Tax=Metschnikowia bicuspidata TaxID=27322 RepID=A0A4P9ZHE8_9ASCO|nr:hypothetical protein METBISCDRAFT_21267 [Metschnikowia bicuspidata]
MKLRIASQLCLAAVCLASSTHELYISAIDILRQLPHKYDGLSPIYTRDNIDQGIWIPQYDWTTQNYQTNDNDINHTYKHLEDALRAIEMLVDAAKAGSSEAASALGDIYTFGNYSVPVNYTKALSFYHKAVSREADGHAYFMLGYMYSTGMFGEVPMDKQRAVVYYEFAAKNNDFNALLVLANNYYHGIGRAANCVVSKFYYAAAARKTMSVLDKCGSDILEDYTTFDIALPDYNGGLYGHRVSESPLTISDRVSLFLSLRESLRDSNFISQDSNIIDYYFDAFESYHGGHFREKNDTEAYISSLLCIIKGGEKFGGEYFDLATHIDKFVWSRCHNLLGKLYLNGHGVEKNVSRAYIWLNSGKKIFCDKETLLTLASFHQLDPSYKGSFTEKGQSYLQAAAANGSGHAAYLLSKADVAPRSPLQTSYTESSLALMKHAANLEVLPALFYYADAVESGYVGEQYDCKHVAAFYKLFVERSEKIMLPHIQYAFEELRYGNYKNSLLGFLIGAEQGLANSQVSAAYLLHQIDPLLFFYKKVHYADRAKAAFRYLELSSAQDHLDSTILLGDLYSANYKAANISVDYAKAFAYYSKAALMSSGHGCYKLGYMYEYGLGSPNNTVDYFMAKRYYDMSHKFYKERAISHTSSRSRVSSFPVTLALLRLRFKMLFSKKSNEKDTESSGWFSTFRKITKSEDALEKESAAQAKAQTHLEGGTYEEDEEYETFDYVVLILTVAFFLYMALENVRGHFRRLGRRQNGPEDQNGVENQNADGAAIPRFQVEFFFAI